MEATYLFPILEPEQIIETFEGYHIPIKPTQLRNPSAEFIYNVCTQIVLKLTGTTPASLAPVADEEIQAQSFLHPEIYRASTNKLLMTRQIASLARDADVSDYTSRYLAMPTATTTAILLSAYINYLAHCQSQTPVVRQIRNEAYSIRDRHAAMRKQAEQAHDAVAELRSIHAKQQALAEELRAEVNGAAPAIMALLTEKAGLEKQMKEAKDEKDDLLKQKEEVTTRRNHLQEQIQATKARIVQSPDRIRRNIAQMTMSVGEMRKTLATNEVKVRDLQAKQAAFAAIERDVRGCIEQLVEIERESTALAAAEKALQDLYDQRDKASVQKNALLLENETVTLQRENAEERLERMQRHQQDRQAAVAQMLERLRTENAQLVIERKENDKEVAELRGEADAIEHRMQVRQDKEQDEINDVLAVYWDLRQQTEIYMQEMERALGLKELNTE